MLGFLHGRAIRSALEPERGRASKRNWTPGATDVSGASERQEQPPAGEESQFPSPTTQVDYFPSRSWNNSCIAFQDFSSAALSYFMPGLFALSASGTVKL